MTRQTFQVCEMCLSDDELCRPEVLGEVAEFNRTDCWVCEDAALDGKMFIARDRDAEGEAK